MEQKPQSETREKVPIHWKSLESLKYFKGSGMPFDSIIRSYDQPDCLNTMPVKYVIVDK